MDENNISNFIIMPWLAKQYEVIKNLFLNKKLPKAILLNGVSGLGKSAMAVAVAKLVLCLSDRQAEGYECDCSNCRNFKNNTLLPDMVILGNDQMEKSSIKVDDIRGLIDVANKTSFGTNNSGTSNKKIFIILNAENLNVSAANALLKILEADDTSNYFILTSSLYYKLPVTIASRCYKLNLSINNTNNLIQTWLHEHGVIDTRQQELLLELSGYAPKKALYYYNNQYIEKFNKLHDILINFNKNMINSHIAQVEKIFTLDSKSLHKTSEQGVNKDVDIENTNQTKNKASKKSSSEFDISSFFELINVVVLKLIDVKLNDINAHKFIRMMNNYKKSIDNSVTIDNSNLIFNALYKYSTYTK